MTKEEFLKKWYVVQAPEVNEEFTDDTEALCNSIYHSAYLEGLITGRYED